MYNLVGHKIEVKNHFSLESMCSRRITKQRRSPASECLVIIYANICQASVYKVKYVLAIMHFKPFSFIRESWYSNCSFVHS